MVDHDDEYNSEFEIDNGNDSKRVDEEHSDDINCDAAIATSIHCNKSDIPSVGKVKQHEIITENQENQVFLLI